MKHVLLYESFESEPIRKVFSREQLSWLDKCTTGTWKYNPATGKVDVKGTFNCQFQDLTDFKGIEFGDVTEDFRCSHNKLTSLAGSPDYVGEVFWCEDNQLTSLEGGPRLVGDKYSAHHNQITSLEGLPERSVGIGYQSVNLRNNPISAGTFTMLIDKMWKGDGMSYADAIKVKWSDIPIEEKTILYVYYQDLPEEEVQKYELLSKYNNVKKMI
jgi:hypothetical protein